MLITIKESVTHFCRVIFIEKEWAHLWPRYVHCDVIHAVTGTALASAQTFKPALGHPMHRMMSLNLPP